MPADSGKEHGLVFPDICIVKRNCTHQGLNTIASVIAFDIKHTHRFASWPKSNEDSGHFNVMLAKKGKSASG